MVNSPSGDPFSANRKKGSIIVLMGIDGTGKSTQASLLFEYLRRKNVRVKKIYGGNTCINVGKTRSEPRSKKRVELSGLFIDWFLQDQALIDRLFNHEPFFSKSELIWRIILEILLASGLSILSYFIGFTGFSPILAVLVVLAITHTINWIFNGHGYQILFILTNKTYPAINVANHLENLKTRLTERGITSILYGSICRGERDEYSDIDICTVNFDGLYGGLSLASLNTVERLRAFYNGISLDIYCIDDLNYLKRRTTKLGKEKSFYVLSDSNNNAYKLGVPTEQFRVEFLAKRFTESGLSEKAQVKKESVIE